MGQGLKYGICLGRGNPRQLEIFWFQYFENSKISNVIMVHIQGLKIISEMDEKKAFSKFYLTSIGPGYHKEGMEALLSKSIFLKFTACETIVCRWPGQP